MRRAGTTPWLLVAAAAALLLTAGAGCGSGTGQTDEASQMTAIAAQIQADLAERPDVRSADVVYQDNLSASGTVGITIKAKANSQLEPIVDQALRLTWQSALTPLHSISVTVVDETDLQRNLTRRVNPSTEKVDLERQYGQRPK